MRSPQSVRKAGVRVGVRDRPQRKTGNEDRPPDPDREAETRRQTKMEQLHLEAYWSMHRLRDALCQRYSALLRDKVNSQRIQLLQRREAERVKSEGLKTPRIMRTTFSKLQHDDSHLKTLHKTSFYLIFDLQTQLAERGRLQTHQDLEDFHRLIEYRRPPSELQKSLEDVRRRSSVTV
ncbi:uncharacterized protein si:ch211-130h14.4 isoform X4 [Xyrichtys novacula]|uniref:Uncharacterized protein si:ch211-130h14.4 isoform X4 n=1 Tax=Xyrichtys novacula TaxID=13765 RepID=A0AAV1G5E4_XYRNO|nr:uncharacterized protein si:ch211-130h14.4 isoform X4 [Xyrichtys novacula]